MTRKSVDKLERIGFYPGTFNPFTKGHLSVLERVMPLFDKIVVAIGYNDNKPAGDETIFNRIEAIKKAVSSFNNVEVISYTGLTVKAAADCGASFLIRGVRDVADFEFERRMADMNRELAGIETLLLFTLPEYSFVSSSVIRELDRYGVDIDKFLP